MAGILKRTALVLAALLALLSGAAWALLRGSLPALDGTLALDGLSAPVAISRDALGVVTIDAATETDALRALGYVHGQERFFEMDLLRRTAAGELSALFGARALETDRQNRVHRMRARSLRDLELIAGQQRPQLTAYAQGVNAGLRSLRVRPWPYLLLRQQPAPWQPVDTALAGQAMAFDLQDEANARELALWRVRQHLPAELFALLTHDGSSWDAPLLGRPRGDAVLPPAEEVDLRTLPQPADAPARLAGLAATEARDIGSNSFAIAGALTGDGRALLANDMHLGLRAPNIWFRARLRHADARAPGGRVDVSGFTLPGLPLVVAGSNGHVAWGFTNSYVDTADWSASGPPCRASATVAGCVPVRRHRETIRVAGGRDEVLEVVESAWGPLLHREPDGSMLALRWAGHAPGAINLGLSAFARAGDLDEALAIAGRTATPTQNLLIADASGRIAWQLLGPLPARDPGCRARNLMQNLPVDRARAAAPACAPWPVRTDAAPLLRDPPAHRLWTANNRMVDDAHLARVGDGGYALGARAAQIRDALFARARFDERDLLDVQLDDRALFLERWWRLLHATSARGGPALQALAGAAPAWPTRASTDAVGYRLVRAWRLAVHERIAQGLMAPALAALGDGFELPALPQLEGVAWPLVTQRPAHLLPRRFDNWDALFEEAAAQVRDDLAGQGALSERSWGERNTAAICHPLAGAIPLLGKRLLCMPRDPLAGDTHMPRVAGPAFGASQRMVVSPGREADGIIHMPGGQSGHPLSPYWGAGHDAWVRGRPTPFLPGTTRHTLRMVPATQARH